MSEVSFVGWEIRFEDDEDPETYNFSPEIVDIAMGQDIKSSVFMCSIKYNVDSSLTKYFSKQHSGTLTIINKMLVEQEEIGEMFIAHIQSVSNSGIMHERDEDNTDANTTSIPVKYMCAESVKLVNGRVGGIYENKKLEDILADLFSKTGCSIPFDLEKPNNQQTYDTICIPEQSFVSAVRYISQHFGLYDAMTVTFGQTFTDEEMKWTLSNINKLEGEDIELNLIPYEHTKTGTEGDMEDRKYFTYMPINIQNNMQQIVRKIPKMIKFVSFDNDKFFKRKDVVFKDVIDSANFLMSSDQFDLLETETQLFTDSRLEVSDYSIKDWVQRIGMNAFNIPVIIIPNPFKIKHFLIGNKIQVKSQVESYVENDIKLLIAGWNLRIQQGPGGNGGGAYRATLAVRTIAASYLQK